MHIIDEDSARSGSAITDVAVLLTWEDLNGIANCINEALEAVDRREFDTRVGLQPGDARRLLDEIKTILLQQPRQS